MRRARARHAAGPAICLAIAVAGCGQRVNLGSRRTAQITVTEYRMTPSALTVRTGRLALTVYNLGRLVHNLAVMQGSHIDAVTQPIWPGSRAVLNVDLRPGTYTLASTLFTDQSLGAYASLDVTR